MTTEKLQKILANFGLASRREIERWLNAGRISVDGKVAKLGDRAEEDAKICVDGKPVKGKIHQRTKVIAYNKPTGRICTRSDPEQRKTVFEDLPILNKSRWIAIGRLDINTSGLLLFTNDGELANKLMHPSSQIEREYSVRTLGEVDKDIIQRLKIGVKLEDGLARFKDIKHAGSSRGANQWYHVVLTEGRNREVRRLWESQNIQVSRLMRIRFGNITLPTSLKPGQWTELRSNEIEKLALLAQID